MRGTWALAICIGSLVATQLRDRVRTGRIKQQERIPATGGLRSNPHLIVQSGHSAAVFSAADSPDGRFVVTGGSDDQVVVWNLSVGVEVQRFRTNMGAHKQCQGVEDEAISPDGKYVAAAAECDLWLWDIASGDVVGQFPIEESGWKTVGFAPDGRFLLAAGDLGVGVWDVRTGTNVQLLGDLSNPAVFSPDGKFLLAIEKRGMRIPSTEPSPKLGAVVLWNTTTWKGIQSFRGLPSQIEALTFSPSGDSFLLAARYFHDSTASVEVQFWDLKSRTRQRTLRLPRHSLPVDFRFSSDGNSILTASPGFMRIWDLGTGRVRAEMTISRRHAMPVILTHGRRAAVFTEDGSVTVRDISGTPPRVLGRLSNPLVSAVSPDGAHIATGDSSGAIYVWSVRTGTIARVLKGHTGGVNGIQFTPDGKSLATASDDKTVRIWEVESGKEVGKLVHPAFVTSVDVSPDGASILTGCADSVARLWETKGGRLIRRFLGHEQLIYSVAFSRDGNYAATASLDYTAKVWLLKTGEPVANTERTYQRESVSFSPDGRYVLVGGERWSYLWDWRASYELELGLVGRQVTSGAFSPNGSQFVTGNRAETAVGFDMPEALSHYPQSFHQERIVRDVLHPQTFFLGHTGVVRSIAFPAGGEYLLSGSGDGTAAVWNPATGRLLCRLMGWSGGHWLVVAPDGRFDTSPMDEIRGIHWVVPDEPLRPLPVEIFMRDYYEPRLLPRLLGGEEMPKVRPLQDLNRVQPVVKIVSVRRGASDDLAEVTVEVSRAEGQFHRDGKVLTIKTDAFDLRLFRGGQLVGQEPEPKAEVEESLKNGVELTLEQLQAWQDARRVKLDPSSGRAEKRFVVRLPHSLAGKKIEFTAYAFNEDRVKSETARASYKVPADVGPVHKRAYLITMGVNAYENERWDLHFAANDAKRIRQALEKRLAGYEVVPVSLISDCRTEGCPDHGDRGIGENHATKDALHAVLQKLAGHDLSEQLKKSLPPGAEGIGKAEPDDLVVLFVSSHGYTSTEGTFYMVPSDSGDTEGHTLRSELLQKWISSDELSGWLRDVDAGDLVMIVDTCHSASTVEQPGFKPGPMGSRGLGQLAYDKGMRILAASQADDVALEVEQLKQGLLTYALVQNGLEDRQAASGGKTTIDGWLQYGVDRVPTLYEEVLARKVQKDTDIDVELSGGHSSLEKPNAFQQPSFFNFQKKATGILLAEQQSPSPM